MRIGIFGSAFNPPTYGHIDAIKQCIKQCDQLYIMPSFNHPLKSNLIDYNLRIEMITSLIEEEIPNSNIIVSNFEMKIQKLLNLDKVFTFTLLKNFQKEFSNDEIVFFIGEDNYKNFKNIFYKGKEIVKCYDVICLKENLDIRSTYIRDRIKKGLNIDKLTSKNIQNLIFEKNLY